jgi:hypothetical protein
VLGDALSCQLDHAWFSTTTSDPPEELLRLIALLGHSEKE